MDTIPRYVTLSTFSNIRCTTQVSFTTFVRTLSYGIHVTLTLVPVITAHAACSLSLSFPHEGLTLSVYLVFILYYLVL